MIDYTPHPYQAHAEEHILNNPRAGLFLEMGLGKTVITLSAVKKLLATPQINRVLIIGPKRVAQHTWTDEAEKWSHLQGLRMSVVLGSEKDRKAALKVKADIYIINRENVVWLTAFYQSVFPFDMVVIDELSSFKSAKAARFKALRRVMPAVKRVVGLTGTPAPNGLLDLWPQMYLLDRGERLGKTLTQYRQQYFTAFQKKGVPVEMYKLKVETDDMLGPDMSSLLIYDKISDICVSMKARDWLELPDRVDIVREVRLSNADMDRYHEFEKEQVLAFMDSLGDDKEISAPNAAALTGKLLQFCNGAVYDTEGKYHEMHMAKMEALEEEMEAANGKPVLVLYSYRHDLERMLRYLKAYKPQTMDTKDVVKRWNAGQIQMLCGHPASMGHGLNMQYGGNRIIHYGRNWSLELYQQVVARLDRQGQIESVINTSLIIPGTYEEKVIAALNSKEGVQNDLMDAVKASVKELLEKYR